MRRRLSSEDSRRSSGKTVRSNHRVSSRDKMSQEQMRMTDIVKLKQELISLQDVENTQNLKIMQLEHFLRKQMKYFEDEDPFRIELDGHLNFYLNRLGKLYEDARKLKLSSEKKIHMLQVMKKEADQHLKSLKQEEERHREELKHLYDEITQCWEKLKILEGENSRDNGNLKAWIV